ncbi:MAG TPA: DUF1931 family protein [Mycobacterium sp.]|nr:DUF1931 family protein [Mycobacterium sp.]
MAPQDLLITKGVQERMREFDKLDEAAEIRELLRQSVRRPPADFKFSEETDQLLPELFGGLSIALARSFRMIDPKLTNPSTEHCGSAACMAVAYGAEGFSATTSMVSRKASLRAVSQPSTDLLPRPATCPNRPWSPSRRGQRRSTNPVSRGSTRTHEP